MAIRKVMVGSFGPFLYDDSKAITDPTFAGLNYGAIVTDGVMSPTGGYSGNQVLIAGVRNNVGTIEYKTRTLTFTNGYVTAVSADSAWTTA